MARFERIVLHIPHSSPVFPFGYGRWSQGIDAHVARWTDWYTDWIFTEAARQDEGIRPVIFPFSRFFCDVERLEDDPLEKVGQGIVYQRFDDCSRALDDESGQMILDRFYRAHIRNIRSLLTPSTFLIDCHSFPSDLSDVEVCIGVNDDWSRPDERLVQASLAIFKECGFLARLNEPYSNSLSPAMPFPYSSMMIELNKNIYLDNGGRLDYERAASVIAAIGEMYQYIRCFRASG